MAVMVITVCSPSRLGQEITKGSFGLRVKLPPARLSTTHGGSFTVILLDWCIFILHPRGSDGGAILRTNPHPLRSWPFSKFSNWRLTSSHVNLLLVRSHQAAITVVNRLIQERNSVTKVRVEPISFDHVFAETKPFPSRLRCWRIDSFYCWTSSRETFNSECRVEVYKTISAQITVVQIKCNQIIHYTRCITQKRLKNLWCPSPFHCARGQDSSFRRNFVTVTSLWQHCVRFDQPKIWTSDLPLQRQAHYRLTNWVTQFIFFN